MLNIRPNHHIFESFSLPVASGYPIFPFFDPPVKLILCLDAFTSVTDLWTHNEYDLTSNHLSLRLTPISCKVSLDQQVQELYTKAKNILNRVEIVHWREEQGLETQNGSHRQQQINTAYVSTAAFPFEFKVPLEDQAALVQAVVQVT